MFVNRKIPVIFNTKTKPVTVIKDCQLSFEKFFYIKNIFSQTKNETIKENLQN